MTTDRFMSDDFLLPSAFARRLFEEAASTQPILDYHSHLPPRDIAANRCFQNLYEIWLEGDHYKWRAMRANGIAETYCTGEAEPYDKFLAWARTVPHTLRNPLYHWTHLELRRYFEIEEPLNEETAPAIWKEANRQLQQPGLHVHGILEKFNVAAVCTTDDPAEELEAHRQIGASNLTTRVFPTFRPDGLMRLEDPRAFNEYIDRLGGVAGQDVATLDGLLAAVRARHDVFHEAGCRISDHGFRYIPCCYRSAEEASGIYERLHAGTAISPDEQEQFATFMLVYTGQLDAEKGWAKQLHLGALRNANTTRFQALGPDTGFDTIGDWPQMERLATYLDHLEQAGSLPKTILYNLNPADNYPLAALAGSFQDGRTAGKIQFGAGWWFLDQLEGMKWQLNALSSVGLLSRFVGMVTDSRSFMSFPRHEYFRRLLCQILAGDVARGELPEDFDLLAGLVRDVCYGNARRYFGFAV